jgi:hypothetical protein
VRVSIRRYPRDIYTAPLCNTQRVRNRAASRQCRLTPDCNAVWSIIGDSGYLLRRYDAIYGSNPLMLGYTGEMPAATVNACGTDDGEWVDTGLYDVDPILVTDGGDCALLYGDQCLVAVQLDVEHPLVLQAFLSGSADGVTNFYVDLPPLNSDWPPVGS